MGVSKSKQAELERIDIKIRRMLLEKRSTAEIEKLIPETNRKRINMIRNRMVDQGFDVEPPRNFNDYNTKKEECIKLFLQGNARKDIAKKLGISHNYACYTIQEYCAQHKIEETVGYELQKANALPQNVLREWDEVTLNILVIGVQNRARKVLRLRKGSDRRGRISV